MNLDYGYVKCKIVSAPVLKSSRRPNETQYHLHVSLAVPTSGGQQNWDTAINVGTNDSDDLLKYKLAFDYSHPMLAALREQAGGYVNLTSGSALPALDFLRTDILARTGPWRDSDVMDGSDFPEPVATLKRLLQKAFAQKSDVYVFGRTYTGGDLGIHDVHMNQGSSGSFINNGTDNHNDHNDTWQDGAVLVDFGQPQWAAYFTAFTQQLVPTDNLGNPGNTPHEIQDSDDGSLAS